MIKLTAALISAYTAVAAVAGYVFWGHSAGLSVLLGGGLMLLNLLGLAFIWSLIFSKKSIALAVLVIIFKYVIFGLFLWSLRSAEWLSAVGLLTGLASLIFAVLGVTLMKPKPLY